MGGRKVGFGGVRNRPAEENFDSEAFGIDRRKKSSIQKVPEEIVWKRSRIPKRPESAGSAVFRFRVVSFSQAREELRACTEKA